MDNYYDIIAESYDELYKEEQQEKIDLVKKYLDIKLDFKLLDVGCGNAFYLDDFNCECIGVDPSEKLLSQYNGKNKVFCASAESLPFQIEEFDIVTSFTAIQNFEHLTRGLEEIKRVGKDLFVLTFIKNCEAADNIMFLIKKMFSEFNIKEIEHPKDTILILKK